MQRNVVHCIKIEIRLKCHSKLVTLNGMSWRDFEDDSITMQARYEARFIYTLESRLSRSNPIFPSLCRIRAPLHLRMHKRPVFTPNPTYMYMPLLIYLYVPINTSSCWIRWHNTGTAAQPPRMLVNWEFMNQTSTMHYGM